MTSDGAVEFPGVDALADDAPAARLAVTPCGRPTSRNVAGASGAAARTTRSSPAGRRENFANLPEFRLGAGPRAVRPGCPPPLPGGPPLLAAVPAAALGTASFALDGTLCHAKWPDMSVQPASAANAARPLDTPDCNSGPGSVPVETSTRSLSAGTAGHRADARGRELDRHRVRLQTEAGPREVLTPNGSSLGKKRLTSSRGAF